MCQKIVNVLAISSSIVSLAVVGSGLYVYVQRDQLIDGVKQQILKGIGGSLPGVDGLAGGALTGPGVAGAGPVGTPPVAPPF